MARSKNFIYANSSIRVGEEPASHRTGSRELDWYPHSSDLWGDINWTQVKTYVNTYCHGTANGAKVIEKTLNVLDKYTGENKQTSIAKEDLAYGITKDLVLNLNNLSMGTSGSAQSLLKYITSKEPGAINTAQNAGFSFENRLSEFIQRLTGDIEVLDPKALKTGGQQVFAGEGVMFYLGDYTENTQNKVIKDMSKTDRDKLVKEIIEQTGIDFKNIVTYVYKEVQREIDGKIQPDIAVVTYKVPQKADITTGSYLTINADYGGLVSKFLAIISNSRLSLKNTSESIIKLGSTNDNTRLRSFVSQFVQKIDRSFASICTFIFSSKNSGNQQVKRYLDWARILYELLGTGQHLELNSRENILVDYLIVNSYNPNGTSGQATVFNVKDLINNFPDGPYNPPFSIYGAEHTDEVVLNLNQVKSFGFNTMG